MLGELTAAQIEDLLRTEVIARLGCISDGRVYVVPVSYVYDGTYVWGHGMDGAKLSAMRAKYSFRYNPPIAGSEIFHPSILFFPDSVRARYPKYAPSAMIAISRKMP